MAYRRLSSRDGIINSALFLFAIKALDKVESCVQAMPHALSFSPAQAAAVTTPVVSGEPDGRMEALMREHAAEVASLQAAFRARLAAAEQDLQVRLAAAASMRALLQDMGSRAAPGASHTAST